jgi:hypothetical protein
MDVEQLASYSLQRVTAYEGLAVDAVLWNDAHGYHQTAQRLHARALHGIGIATGLSVVADNPPVRGVIVQAGLAVDRDGNVIRVPQPTRLALRTTDAGAAVAIVLRYIEAPVTANGSTPNRVNEAFELIEAPLPLAPTDIELARVLIADAAAPVRDASNPWDPKPNEIDSRSRRELRGASDETLAVGRLITADAAANALHRQGLVNIVREMQATEPFAVSFAGDLRADQAADQCRLLYITGAGELRLTPKDAAGLLAFLRGGGVIFAEPCAEVETARQENGRFVASFQRLMTDLKYALEEVRLGHPLFRSRYIFGAAPDGFSGRAPILCRYGVVLNPNDYGCCWQGGTAAKPLAREVIRSAMEFAGNVASYATQSIDSRK